MSKPYGKWPSRKEAEARAKEIRDNNRNRCLQGQDFVDMFAYFYEGQGLGYEAGAKLVKGISSIKVERNADLNVDHWHFVLYYADCKPPKIQSCDIYASKESRTKKKVDSAMRNAVRYQTNLFREFAATELNIDITDMHVDHAGNMEFADIARKFLAQENIKLLQDVSVVDREGILGGALLADEGFTSRWQMFHAKHALLRLLTKEQHNKKTYALRSKDEERIKAIANDPELVVDPSHESVWKTVQKNLLKELSTPYLHIDSEGRLTVTSNRNKR